MAGLIATLLYDIQKDATSIEIVHTDAYLNFTATGGFAYLGQDYFSYTAFAAYTFTGVKGLRYSHLAGEEVSPTYGIRMEHLIPKLEFENTFDPDSFMTALQRIIDDGYFEELKRYNLGITRLSDPTVIPEEYLKHYCMSIGLEYNENESEDIRRRLACTGSDLMKARGNLAAFKFITWHVLGYDVDVDIRYAKIPSRMNDRAHRMLQPPYEMILDDRTVGLWYLEEGTGTTCANELSTGDDMTLQHSAMWSTDSMFVKDTSLEISLAHPYATVPGAAGNKANIHGKEEFAIELFIDPATSLLFPQYIVAKSPNLLIYRTNATNLVLWMSNGTDSDTVTIADIITPNENQLLSILYSRPIVQVCINGSVVYEGTFFDYSVIDAGNVWQFGDIAGANPFIGKIDTPHISVGLKRPNEVYTYWEHIALLRSYEADPDMNSYMFVANNKDGFAEIAVNNDEGDDEKHSILEYLIAEWLGAGDYSVIYAGNLPIERKYGMFNRYAD